MDILTLAEKHFVFSLGVILIVGLLQGAILGRGIRNKFPKFKIHARVVSICLLVLFSINSLANIFKFANPEKLALHELTIPKTPQESVNFIFEILGFDLGFGSLIVVFVSVTLVLFFRYSDLSSIARYFTFSLSFILLLVGVVTKFTDFAPNQFQIFLYSAYHFGITLGIFVVTRRKESDILNEIK